MHHALFTVQLDITLPSFFRFECAQSNYKKQNKFKMADITCWWMTCYLLLVALVFCCLFWLGISRWRCKITLLSRRRHRVRPHSNRFEQNGINFVVWSMFSMHSHRGDGRECLQPFAANRLDLSPSLSLNVYVMANSMHFEIKAGNVWWQMLNVSTWSRCCNCSKCSRCDCGGNSNIYMVAGDRFTYNMRFACMRCKRKPTILD